MPIIGTNKADHLVGTAGDDVIEGRRGNDWLGGGRGNDILTGGAGRDTFALRAGDGVDVITDYQQGEDRLLFDAGVGRYDGQLGGFFGPLYDGQVFSNSNDSASWTVSAVDYNGDGVTDTRIDMSTGGSFVVLGLAPNMLGSADIFGG